MDLVSVLVLRFWFKDFGFKILVSVLVLRFWFRYWFFNFLEKVEKFSAEKKLGIINGKKFWNKRFGKEFWIRF